MLRQTLRLQRTRDKPFYTSIQSNGEFSWEKKLHKLEFDSCTNIHIGFNCSKYQYQNKDLSVSCIELNMGNKRKKKPLRSTPSGLNEPVHIHFYNARPMFTVGQYLVLQHFTLFGKIVRMQENAVISRKAHFVIIHKHWEYFSKNVFSFLPVVWKGLDTCRTFTKMKGTA